MQKTLPIYQVFVSTGDDNEWEIDCVSLVDRPAIKKVFLAFEGEEGKTRLAFSEVNKSERIVVGPAMIPDMLIYRNNKELGECNTYFSSETIKTVAENFYLKGFNRKTNIMHDSNTETDGINFFMSFIRDSEKGLVGMAGDYPDGTWFLGAKIIDEQIWGLVESGDITGFSVEGLMGFKRMHTEEQAVKMVEELMESDDEDSFEKIGQILEQHSA